MPSRKVLTVNQVADIMLRWLDTRDWAAAFDAAIPKRKFKRRKRGGPTGEDAGEGSSPVADTTGDDPTLAPANVVPTLAPANDVQLHGA